MVTAIPDVKPTVIVVGTNLISPPNLHTPIIIRMTPAIRVAKIKPSIPCVAITPATIVANAAVGPAI